VDKGLRTKEGEEYDSSPWQVLAEELEALFEDSENIFEVFQEMSRTDAGKVGLVAATGFTAWVVLFNIKLAFELFVCAVVLDQVGSSWDNQPVSIWVKIQRIQQRIGQFANASAQVERLRSELATVYGKVKDREKGRRIEKAKGHVVDIDGEHHRIELLQEEIAAMSAKEGTLLGELREFLSSTAGKSQAALGVTLSGLVVTHSDELFNAAVALLFVKVLLDRITTRAEKKGNPLFVEFERMVQRDRDDRTKKLAA
jgi:hypothetical protein